MDILTKLNLFLLDEASTKKVYIIAGIPGSGKSTWVKHNLPKALYLNADTYRKKLTGDASNQSKNDEVFKALASDYIKALNNDSIHSIVIDNTNTTYKQRKYYYDKALKASVTDLNLILMNTPLHVSLKRNKERDRVVPDDVIIAKHNELQSPTAWERKNVKIVIVHPS